MKLLLATVLLGGPGRRTRVRTAYKPSALDGIADGLNALDTQPFEEYADRHYHAAW